MQDLDDAGSVYGCARIQSEILDSQIAKGLMQIIKLCIQEKFSGV